MKNVFLVLALAFMSSVALPQTPLQRSHIEGNVPSQATFNVLLNRDLLAYFKRSGLSSATAVEPQLLREGPTQSGIAYPKYYVWVTVRSNEKFLVDGAMRIAAIDQEKFEVTDYFPRALILNSPENVAKVFPRPLVGKILSLAESK